MQPITEIISIPEKEVSLHIRREDLIHPLVSGNKYRKLKYNLAQATAENQTRLLTFGGAFSNHIAATAAAGKEYGFETVGVIRGEELSTAIDENPTLHFAQQCGMTLEFVSRETYRNKADFSFLDNLRQKFGHFYLLPEGGTNALAVKGCEEILGPEDFDFDYICCAAGTGGTAAGIINSSADSQQVLVFPALKGDFLQDEMRKFATKENWKLVSDYHFGGYAKINTGLIAFINDFYKKNAIPLDPVYTAKLFFGVMDLVQKDYFAKGSKILLIHTGGIQGIKGMNNKLKNKNLPIIDIDA
jgi:1-aminocyclopropane-1-carboxylate deaminase